MEHIPRECRCGENKEECRGQVKIGGIEKDLFVVQLSIAKVALKLTLCVI